MMIAIRAATSLFIATALCAIPQAQCYLDKTITSDASERASFGKSVSMYGDTLVIGADYDSTVYQSAGAAYLYERVDGEWEQAAKLIGSTTGMGDSFGRSVSMWNETLLVGGPGNNVPFLNGGTVYVFDKVGTAWVETATLHPPAGSSPFLTGESVSLHEDTALVGARHDHQLGWNVGAVYVHERSGGIWSRTAKLLPAPAPDKGEFGYSVAVSGDLAVVGAPTANPLGANTGAVYLFRRVSGVWIKEDELVGSGLVDWDRFGNDVEVCGDTVVVGSMSGIPLHVFEKTGSTWTETAKLHSNDFDGGDKFGSSVSISGDVLLVGACGNSAAYLFERTGTSWSQTAKISSSTGNIFGTAVGLDRSRSPVVPPLAIDLVVGATADTEGGYGAGAAYFLDYAGQGCPSFSAVPSDIFDSTGGTQHLSLDGGPASAGKLYFVVGSMSGTMPGTDFGGLTIPLNMDGYTLFSMMRANQPPYVNTMGVLDSSGRAAGEIHVPPGFSQWIRLYHAFFVLDFGTLSVDLVSNAEPLILWTF